MEYKATIDWTRNTEDFDTKKFDRTHDITFGGGIHVSASSAPEYAGKAELVNPEELFVASISSCFMLTLLYIAAMRKLTIDNYTATATGKLGKNADGKMCITDITIKPTITFSGESPDAETLQQLAKKAHDNCFISCSVNTKVTIEV